MPLTIRPLTDAIAARLGWRRIYDDAQTEELLTEQDAAANALAAEHAALATTKNRTPLYVQPCVLDTRGRVLHDVAYLQGLLTGARTHDFPEDLVERLAGAVDCGHDLAELLATIARATTVRGTDCG